MCAYVSAIGWLIVGILLLVDVEFERYLSSVRSMHVAWRGGSKVENIWRHQLTKQGWIGGRTVGG